MRPDPHPSDYPERLRRVDVDSALRPLMLDAAAEIERLRAALEDIATETEESGWHVIQKAKRALELRNT